jgi:hypothetical protein
MDFINKTLLNVFSKTLKKNEKFKNIHKGESCYIFGNGSSLKYYDLKLFNDRISIGCGALFSHNDIKEIDLKYYYVSHPLFFYNFWKNSYSGKYEKNKIGSFYKRKIKRHSHSDIEYFVSLSNYFGIQGKNINYVYHFGQADRLNIGNQMDGVFSMMTGALPGMIGMALYMGFENITLVGCDYTSNPRKNSHFFEFGEETDVDSDDIFYGEILNSASELAKINTIVIDNKYKGKVIPSISYFDFTNSVPIYKENSELISPDDLLDLDSSNMTYKIY